MNFENLKDKNISIHVAATGAGAGIQNMLWAIPGSSAYLSGASFPYSPEEHQEFVGFQPEQYCSEEDAIDLASAAYIKAYRFGGKKPVGLGITATVASEKEHRGDHRLFGCIMTDDKILLWSRILDKGVGYTQRFIDGKLSDAVAQYLLSYVFDYPLHEVKDVTQLATARFFERPFFTSDGKRLGTMPTDSDYALMPGAFNPPHEGHLGMGKAYKGRVVFEITATTPHKDPLSVQDMLKRAKLLQGHDRLFTRDIGLYIEKARAFPHTNLLLGADAMVRILDPKWGLDVSKMLEEFRSLNTGLYVASRIIDGKLVTQKDIAGMLSPGDAKLYLNVCSPLKGEWDISSTQIRNKL